MHSEYWFSDLTGSLKNGFFADGVILALSRILKNGAATSDDREILQKAASMLDMAICGHDWLDKPEVSSRAATCASFFGQAVKALPLVSTSAQFLEHLTALRETAKELSERESLPERERIAALRAFFFSAAQSELEKTEQLLDRESDVMALRWVAAQ